MSGRHSTCRCVRPLRRRNSDQPATTYLDAIDSSGSNLRLCNHRCQPAVIHSVQRRPQYFNPTHFSVLGDLDSKIDITQAPQAFGIGTGHRQLFEEVRPLGNSSIRLCGLIPALSRPLVQLGGERGRGRSRALPSQNGGRNSFDDGGTDKPGGKPPPHKGRQPTSAYSTESQQHDSMDGERQGESLSQSPLSGKSGKQGKAPSSGFRAS